MITSLSTPYNLTDQGYVFILHDLESEYFPAYWHQELSNPLNWHGGLAFAFDKSQSLYLLRFSGMLTISVSLVTKVIDLWPEPSLSPETLKHILIDQLVPRIFAAQGALVLHAGAVCVDGKAIALMGDTGAGKSTLVASFYLQGSTLVNDDAVVVTTANGQFYVSASHPSLRLLPDSLVKLFADMPNSTPISKSSSKRHIVILEGKRHVKSDFPLNALFFIGNGSDQKISFRQLAPAEAVMAIVKNSFALNPTDVNFVSANLYRACRLAESIPAFELHYPRSYEVLPDVHRVILDKLEELQA